MSYIHSHSTTVPASDTARLAVTASNAARASMHSLLPEDTSPSGPSPSAEPYSALVPTPAAVTFRHVKKVVMQFEKEPVGITFTSPFAVSNFFNDISLFDAAAGP
ncbi:hypothetical protein CTA2_11690 [Colletotrichum tanaceti]|uniref:Uncharacterized protein n=1 Tax=Colletotrichum tanaceti TaxID=1306861 RepID=A0A4U6X8Q9_9PEZI|nr:hypothetical protein CTA2_11695 [Colletotrichum tanaceti]KAJ0165304.1 hypothetical protein CTA2_11690 [Colletotrichum tanaceti]TKW51940.1 hypothetical protein CTA1_5811 [Colletotrichum tanaceti]